MSRTTTRILLCTLLGILLGSDGVQAGGIGLPGELSASEITNTSAKVSWSASSPEKGEEDLTITYEVQYGRTDYRGDGWTSAGKTTALSLKITGLMPATNYAIRVKARDTDGSSSSWRTRGETNPLFRTTGGPVATSSPPPKASSNVCFSRAIPTGEMNSSVMFFQREMPREVSVGVPFTYINRVTSLESIITLQEVVLVERLPENFQLDSSSPNGTSIEGNKLQWNLGTLAPKETKVVKITGRAKAAGALTPCAQVTYKVPMCCTLVAVAPKLSLSKTAPKEVVLCDEIPIQLTVINTGTGTARNVTITDSLPAGLTTADGKSSLRLSAGDLGSGRSRTFSARLKASKTGTYENKAVATAEGGLTAQAATTTVVRQPVLAIKKTAPAKRYVDRDVTYEITVTNIGDAAAADTVLTDAVPSGAEFAHASGNGALKGGTVVWRLGTLKPKDSKTVSMTVHSDRIGAIRNTAKAVAVCASEVSASARTEIAGIPAILLEVIDVEDPIEVGDNETYVIIATNQGSAPGTSIKIVCELEDTAQYVSAKGATVGSAKGQTITFAPLGSLASKDKATWRVTVKAVKSGDTRFKVTMTSDQMTRPVTETESTTFYE